MSIVYVAALIDFTERKDAEKTLIKVQGNLEKLVEEQTTQLEKAHNSLNESEKRNDEALKCSCEQVEDIAQNENETLNLEERQQRTTLESRARIHLANERTFLAWLRTGIALIDLGWQQPSL